MTFPWAPAPTGWDYNVEDGDGGEIVVTWWPDAESPEGTWPEGPIPQSTLRWSPDSGWTVVEGAEVPSEVLARINFNFDPRRE